MVACEGMRVAHAFAFVATIACGASQQVHHLGVTKPMPAASCRGATLQASDELEQRHSSAVARLKDAIAGLERRERQLLKAQAVAQARASELERAAEAAQAEAEAARLAVGTAVAAAHTQLQQQARREGVTLSVPVAAPCLCWEQLGCVRAQPALGMSFKRDGPPALLPADPGAAGREGRAAGPRGRAAGARGQVRSLGSRVHSGWASEADERAQNSTRWSRSD